MSARAKRTVVVMLALALIASFFVWRLFRIHGFIVALAPVSGTSAVVCLRANAEYGLAPRAWIGRLDVDRGWVWSSRLTGLPMGAHRGLIVHDGLAIVRTQDGPIAATTAYAIEDGRRVWSTAFERHLPTAYLDLIAAGPHVVQGMQDSAGSETLVALAKASGRIEWRLPIARGESLRAPRVLGSSLALGGLFEATIVPLDGAAPRAVAAKGEGACVEHGELVYLEGSGRRIMAAPLSGVGDLRVVVPVLTFPPHTSAAAVRCGRYRGHIVFTTILYGEKSEEAGLLEIDPDAGVQVRFDALGARHIALIAQGNADLTHPDSAPLNGEVPPFVPLVIDAAPLHEFQLAILDMQARRIVRRGPSSTERLFTHIVKDGETFYLAAKVLASGAVDIARFDGKTGTITAAVRVPDVEDLRLEHIRGGRVWIYRSAWIDPLPYAVLDAASLEPLKSGGMTTESLPPAVATAWFGGLAD